MPNITVSEAIAQRVELEAKVAAACVAFHAATGVKVSRFDVDLVTTMDRPPAGSYQVKAEVRL